LGLFFKWKDMHHPTEEKWHEFAACAIALFLCGNRPGDSEPRIRNKECAFPAAQRKAEVHVLVPLSDAERDQTVEILFIEPCRCGVHCAKQTVTVACLFVKE